jgi:hypothetical protein
MLYTKGIRKILTADYVHFENLIEIAKATKADAFTHNGDIYIRHKKTGEYIETPFHISDFQVTFGEN